MDSPEESAGSIPHETRQASGVIAVSLLCLSMAAAAYLLDGNPPWFLLLLSPLVCLGLVLGTGAQGSRPALVVLTLIPLALLTVLLGFLLAAFHGPGYGGGFINLGNNRLESYLAGMCLLFWLLAGFLSAASTFIAGRIPVLFVSMVLMPYTLVASCVLGGGTTACFHWFFSVVTPAWVVGVLVFAAELIVTRLATGSARRS